MTDYIQIHFGLTDSQYSRLTVQHKQILDYIAAFGSITPMDAFSDLGITKLATRISEMRQIGVRFEQDYDKCINRLGKPAKFMRYRKAAA